jgi:preprotein translocase SecF subunit
MSGEMQKTAAIAVAIACVAMLIYVSIRFKDLKMGACAILALVHDVCIMIAFYAVFRIPVNNSFIAALLTVLGYSINATIVVFDRIRENRGIVRRMELTEIINLSLRQTMRRSLYTSLTTLFAIGAVYAFGVKSIREFALPMMVGIISGAYSSVLLASSLWYVMVNKKKAR